MLLRSRRILGRLVAALFTSGLLASAACSTQAEEPDNTVEESTLQQIGTRWSDTFSAASYNGDAAMVDAERSYLMSVDAAVADQLADLLGSEVFTHAGMREALVNSLNKTGRYGEALAELALLDGLIQPSRLAYLRAINGAQVDVRDGVTVDDVEKRDALVAALIANEPADKDAWSALYAYNLGTGLFIANRTDEALDQLLPMLGDEGAEPQLGVATIGSAMNMSVTALKVEADFERAQQMLERLTRFDDVHGVNYAGRYGEETNPNDAH
ncbi:MAG: hypothetical protein AB7T06_34710 [Kofleriaceae bacterium]